MKIDINSILNKLTAYAIDNLLLDPLDQTYALNRLSTLCGLAEPKLDYDADYGDATLAELLESLAAAAPQVDKAAVIDIIFPMPRTINYYLENKLARGADKAFDFLFDLYAHGYKTVSTAEAVGENGYLCYSADDISPAVGAALTVGGEQLLYTPIAVSNRIASLQNPDILSDDIVRRLAAYATEYGGTIATRIGEGADYMCCAASALSAAKAEKQLADGAVKIALLDYPVPALSFNGIAKNTVIREVCRVIKSAAEQNIPCVVAADNKNGVTLYVVFAAQLKADEFIYGGDALSACGVVRTKDCTPLLPVLEKGTALSTDLSEFKLIYDKIGGVKHGKNAQKELGGALVVMYLPILAAAASATKEQVAGLTTADK
ncbi:MAG: hypothetical protein J1F69_05300 [Clostridiales bacterium]|nr:hypothetical protein [Clostridiales bacterium]